MKVISLCQSPSGRGGVETIMSYLDAELSLKGNHVITCLTRSSFESPSWESTLSHVLIGNARDSVTARRIWNAIPVYHWLKTTLIQVKPDVVITHHVLLVPLLKLAMRWSPDLPHFGIIVYEHGSLSVINQQSPLFKEFYYRGLHAADQVVCGGQDYADALDTKAHVKSIAIGLPITLSAETIERSTKAIRILYVGRLENHQKRVDRLLRACGQLPSGLPWTLQLVGDGPHRQYLMSLAQQLGIASHCIWSGWQPHPWEVVEEATMLAFPSDHEGYSAVVVEAMARGIPVLSTDCDFGPRTVIREGVNGWLVPVTDADFAAKLHDIVSGKLPLPDAQTVRSSVFEHQSDRWAARLMEVCYQAVGVHPAQHGTAVQ